ncbi:hypothetical protein [Furfurilactobacillus entadae]|uniref:hypothetical protein n=1 Tax=Furfurilactobacillus entadae TaxID=2922307 RepID=UPI0035EA640B
MKQVAGTILTIEDNVPSFLVTKGDKEQMYGFFSTGVEEGKTALASILDQLKGQLDLDLEGLRLSELTSCQICTDNVSLFVFDHLLVDEALQKRAEAHQMAFVQGNELHELFTDVKFDSAPLLD